MPWRRSFEGFVEATQDVRTVRALSERLLAILLYRGFDHVNFTVEYDHRVPEAYRGFGIINTYPSVWQTYYRDRNLQQIDPVAHRAKSVFDPFTWRQLERSENVPRHGRAFLREADDFGLHNGLGVPFEGPPLQKAGIAMASSERRHLLPSELDIVAGVCNHFYKIYRRLIGRPAFDGFETVTLSIDESQVLVRVGYGLTNKQVAQALNMKPSKVDWILRCVFEKLNVHDRGLAAIICAHLGLIEIPLPKDTGEMEEIIRSLCDKLETKVAKRP